MKQYVNVFLQAKNLSPKHFSDPFHKYTSGRRLPTRLFSTTRRFFGSSYANSGTPATPTSPTTPGLVYNNTAGTVSLSNGSAIPMQQRRLAEFATILGDFKLAVSVWESLRKETRGAVGSVSFLLEVFEWLSQFLIILGSVRKRSRSYYRLRKRCNFMLHTPSNFSVYRRAVKLQLLLKHAVCHMQSDGKWA